MDVCQNFIVKSLDFYSAYLLGVTCEDVSYGALDIKFNTVTSQYVSYGPEKLTLSRSSTWAMVRKNVQKGKASFL